MSDCLILKTTFSYLFLAALFRASQSIFVDRKDPSSRIKTAQAIRNRAQANGVWPQLFVCPEGMIGNQECLLPFKLGKSHKLVRCLHLNYSSGQELQSKELPSY